MNVSTFPLKSICKHYTFYLSCIHLYLTLLRFQTWDFGGDIALDSDVMYRDTSIPIEKLLRNSCTLLYVIDAQEDDYEDSLPKLVELISFAHRINPKIHFEVFLHKIDGDAMSDEDKSYRQQHIQNYVSSELSVAGQVGALFHIMICVFYFFQYGILQHCLQLHSYLQ